MEKELVSVVITSYKRDCKYVEEAVNSVQEQTYANLEIIVVDDNGNEDYYSNALQELCKAKNVRYIKNEKNSGAQYSRNIGILESKGDFVAFLDDDDLWVSDKIEKQMMYFEDPEVGMVFCDGFSFEDGNIDKKWSFREASIYDRPITLNLELFNDFIGSTSQALVKKECFARVGMFDCDMPARQDYEMWLRICKQYKVVGCPEKLLLYRSHSGERISKTWKKCFDSYQLVLEKHRKEYKHNSFARAKIILRLFDWSVKGKQYGKAVKYLTLAFLTNPKCTFGVIDRNIRKIPFDEYYKDMLDNMDSVNMRR